MSTVRRIYFYAVSLVTLVLASWGAGILLAVVLSAFKEQVPLTGGRAYSSQQLALGLSMLVIAGIAFVLHWRTVQRYASSRAGEAGAAIRKLYLNLLLAASSLTALISGIATFRWLFGGASNDLYAPGTVATFIVALAVWAYNWRVETADPPSAAAGRTLQRWYRYLVAAWSLFIFAGAATYALSAILDRAMFFGQSIAQGTLWSSEMQYRLAAFLLGGLWWWFHWFRAAGEDANATLRQVYLYLYAILGGAAAALVGLAIGLFYLLGFALGAGGAAGVYYLEPLSAAIPIGAVGAAAWIYHRQVASDEAAADAERRSSARRVYQYLQSGLGLAATVVGLVVLIGLALDFALSLSGQPGLVPASGGWWKQPLALFIVLLALGVPFWLRHWVSARGDARRSTNERSARSRKIYLYTFLCLSAIAVIAGLISTAYRLLGMALQGASWVDALVGMKAGVQVLLVAAPILVYHVRVLREDVRSGSEKAVATKTVTIVSDAAADPTLGDRLRRALGPQASIRALYLDTGPAQVVPLPDDRLAALAEEIRVSAGASVAVVVRGVESSVYPYREG